MNNEEKILQLLTEMKQDISSMNNRLGNVEKDISGIKQDITNLESQVDENTQILKALEHSSEVNKAEHENMLLQFSRLSGTVSSVKQDTCQIQETNQSLLEMYGKHEADICTLRRRIV